jgi:hypothetical protein
LCFVQFISQRNLKKQTTNQKKQFLKKVNQSLHQRSTATRNNPTKVKSRLQKTNKQKIQRMTAVTGSASASASNCFVKASISAYIF